MRNEYDNQAIELASHGYDIFLSDITNFVLIIFIGYCTNSMIHSLIFYFAFSFLRMSTGGFHCSTKILCTALYLGIYLLFIVLLKFGLFENIQINFILTLIATLTILYFAPVQHINNPLTKMEIKSNRNKVIWKTITFFNLYVILLLTNNYIYPVISVIIIYTAILLLFHMQTCNYIKESAHDY